MTGAPPVGLTGSPVGVEGVDRCGVGVRSRRAERRGKWPALDPSDPRQRSLEWLAIDRLSALAVIDSRLPCRRAPGDHNLDAPLLTRRLNRLPIRLREQPLPRLEPGSD
jgi:hypothetical protein